MKLIIKQLNIVRKILAKILPASILFSVAIVPVQAGLLDWFDNGREIPRNSSQSFVFANPQLGINDYLSSEGNDQLANLATIHGGFIVGTNSPAKNPVKQPIKFREMIVPATAYSSTPDQTDDSPFITAWNTHVRDGIVAANFLPFGTKIRIPDVYGDKIFVVEDRMNRRYWHKVDIWFPDRQSALEFGLRTIKIQILES